MTGSLYMLPGVPSFDPRDDAIANAEMGSDVSIRTGCGSNNSNLSVGKFGVAMALATGNLLWGFTRMMVIAACSCCFEYFVRVSHIVNVCQVFKIRRSVILFYEVLMIYFLSIGTGSVKRSRHESGDSVAGTDSRACEINTQVALLVWDASKKTTGFPSVIVSQRFYPAQAANFVQALVPNNVTPFFGFKFLWGEFGIDHREIIA